MALVKHLSDGTNTYDLPDGGTTVTYESQRDPNKSYIQPASLILDNNGTTTNLSLPFDDIYTEINADPGGILWHINHMTNSLIFELEIDYPLEDYFDGTESTLPNININDIKYGVNSITPSEVSEYYPRDIYAVITDPNFTYEWIVPLTNNNDDLYGNLIDFQTTNTDEINLANIWLEYDSGAESFDVHLRWARKISGGGASLPSYNLNLTLSSSDLAALTQMSVMQSTSVQGTPSDFINLMNKYIAGNLCFVNINSNTAIGSVIAYSSGDDSLAFTIMDLGNYIQKTFKIKVASQGFNITRIL